MKKMFKIVRNIVLGIILFVYLSFIVLVSTLLLNRNDYGVTQFGDKVLISIDETVSTEKYSVGSLIIAQNKKIKELKVGDEIFIYKTNKRENTVQIIISEIGKISTEDKNEYVVLKNDGTSWGEDFIAGVEFKSYEKIGSFMSFIESKWVFFCLLIVPCFFILLYEIHLVIVTLRFGDLDEELEFEAEQDKKYQETIDSKNEEIEALMKQINELKKDNDVQKEEKETVKKETKKSEAKKEKEQEEK